MLSTCSYSLLCNIIYIFKIDCNFFSTLGAAGGLFFRLNRPTAAAKRVYSTTHTRKHNLLLPVSPEVAVSKACAVITVSSLQAQKNVTAWAPEPPVPPFNQCSTAWCTSAWTDGTAQLTGSAVLASSHIVPWNLFLSKNSTQPPLPTHQVRTLWIPAFCQDLLLIKWTR